MFGINLVFTLEIPGFLKLFPNNRKVKMEFKKYRATRKNVELLRKALNELGHTTYEDYSLDLPYPTKHNINSMLLEHFQREFWSDMYNNEVNYKMQELEKEL